MASTAKPDTPRTRVPVPRQVQWFIVLLAPSAIAYGFFLVWIPAYLPELGFDSGTIGLLLGVNGGALILGSIPLSILADRKGKKRVLLAALLVFPPIIATFALTLDVRILVVASFLAGLVDGAFSSTWNALIADQTVPENRDPAFALSFIVSALSTGAGYTIPFFLPPLEAATGVDSRTVHVAAFLVLAAGAVVSPIALFFLFRGYRDAPPSRQRFFRGRDLRLLGRFSGYNGLIGLGAGFIIPLIPTWLFLKFAVPDSFSGPVLGIASLTIGFAAVASSRLAKRWGRVPAIAATQGLSTAFMLALAFAPSPISAGAIYVVRASLMNMSIPLADSFVMGIVEPDQRSFASALNSLVWRIPNSVSTVAGGVLMASGHLDLPIFIATAFYVVAIGWFYAAFRDVKTTT
ncbi:MAG TPA: MFS transporter [Thermoplasmata archaeon]|nr:MFS transporter [Thermoplasmata archaeon]